MSTIWHNGKFMDEGPVFLPNDRVRVGDGVFDTMMAVDGETIHGILHFERLLNHANVMKISIEMDAGTLEKTARELLARNKYHQGRYVINTIISRGPAERGLRVPERTAPQVIITVSTAPLEFPPVQAVIAQGTRRNEGSPLCGIKSFNYGDNILALIEAREKGGNEAIMLNNKGSVAGASASNIFMVDEHRRLFTPPLQDGAMNGVVREKMFKMLGAKEKTILPDELFSSAGLYVTNSVRGVAVIETLDGKKIRRPSLEIDKEFHLI